MYAAARCALHVGVRLVAAHTDVARQDLHVPRETGAQLLLIRREGWQRA
jgi:hypothetical protein